MTKEKLKQEAEEYAKKHKYYEVERRNGIDCAKEVYIVTIEQAYMAGAKPREEQIAKIEAKIEEMKKDVYECFGYEYNVLLAKLLNKWERKENDR